MKNYIRKKITVLNTFLSLIAMFAIINCGCETKKAKEERAVRELHQQMSSSTTNTPTYTLENNQNIENKNESVHEKTTKSKQDEPKVQSMEEFLIQQGRGDLVEKQRNHLKQMEKVHADNWTNTNLYNQNNTSQKKNR